MMFKTHLAFGLFVALFVSEFFDLSQKGLFITLVAISSIIPDIDLPTSKIGRKVPPLSWIFNLLFGHRGLLHTIFFPFLIYFILTVFDKNLWAGAFFLGYMSHLIIDAFTVKGIYFFYPISKVKVNGFIRTGGFLEWVLFIVILGGIGFLLI